MARRVMAELIGTAILVFIGAGVATMVFGFHFFGFRSAASIAAGVLTIGMAFGLVLLALVYVIGPVSACHVNPAVTLGSLLVRRITLIEAAWYWAAQFVGGILGALLLWGLFSTSPFYDKATDGLGADGWGSASILHISAGGAFLAEVVLTGIFVFVVLTMTRPGENKAIAGIPIGLTLTFVHIFGVPIDGTSVNPARSLGPALVSGGTALNQVWLFILAPLVGAVLAAGVHLLLHPTEPEPAEEIADPKAVGDSPGAAS
ncbi:MAG TPA: aquaporin [Streptosporangiaceae bacterium]|jgi:aquaporin Z